ncbi:hypothetical protein LSAT2_007398 [Lamellibrachia satsuma]|nr:hypothetical protein LSAT2_007398 [Lamellibrachia satsuma]
MPWNQLPASLWPSSSPWAPWIRADFVLRKPWSDSKCFHAWLGASGGLVSSPTPFVPQVNCPLCNNTLAAAGFAPDPNDCNAYYVCTPYGTVWTARRMTCAKCQFWDQEVLTCMPVQGGPECASNTAVYTGPKAVPQPIEGKSMHLPVEAPAVSTDDHTLEEVEEFINLGSTITSNLFFDAEINKHTGKAATAMSRLSKRVWEKNMLTENTNVPVY